MRHTYHSILVIRLSAIGDVVMASPLIQALYVRYPNARIAWLVQPEAAALLEANRQLDEVILWPRDEWRKLARDGRWLRLARAIWAFTRALRARHFDLVLDAQGLLKSAVFARLSGARRRIGLRSKEGSRLLMTEVVESPPGEKIIGKEYRHLARVLGYDGELRMVVSLTEADRRYARDLIERERLENGYAVLCPFTTRPQKHWVEGYWPALTRQLSDELGLRAVMLGGPGDRVAAARLAATEGVLDLAGRTTLRQAAALIEHARLLVGVDTGLTHMGSAFAIPTIALFGSTRPYLVTDSSRTVVLYKDLPCAPCKRHPTCGGAYTCMREVTVDDVLAQARRLLAA